MAWCVAEGVYNHLFGTGAQRSTSRKCKNAIEAWEAASVMCRKFRNNAVRLQLQGPGLPDLGNFMEPTRGGLCRRRWSTCPSMPIRRFVATSLVKIGAKIVVRHGRYVTFSIALRWRDAEGPASRKMPELDLMICRPQDPLRRRPCRPIDCASEKATMA